MTPTKLFIAYSRKDAELLDELKKYLQPIVLKYNLTIWDDKEIDAGATWEDEIKKNLSSADIFLLLITANSLASDYFHDKELPFAIERHKKGEVQIIPIIMRSCGWKHSPIADLQVLPAEGKPVYSSHWSFVSEAYSDVVDGIEKILLQKKEQTENQKGTPTKSSTPTSKKTPTDNTQLEEEQVLRKKMGLIILKRSFYASIPFLGAALATLLGVKYSTPAIDTILDSNFYKVILMIGVFPILGIQIIKVVNDFNDLVDGKLEENVATWSIVLTFILYVIICGLGLLFIQMILDLLPNQVI